MAEIPTINAARVDGNQLGIRSSEDRASLSRPCCSRVMPNTLQEIDTGRSNCGGNSSMTPLCRIRTLISWVLAAWCVVGWLIVTPLFILLMEPK